MRISDWSSDVCSSDLLVAHAAHAQEPKDFTVAPIGAINKVLAKAGWSIGDVDLFEVNEAFACVAMFAMHDLGISHDRINVHGGATALGHPTGASGRSEERRVGEGCGGTCSSRWSP